MRSFFKQTAVAFAAVFFLTGCATYQSKVKGARDQLLTNADQAVEKLRPLAEEEGRDQLVYLLDYATALQAAGRYEESAQQFIRAEKLAELKDYHSVSKVAASLVLSEEMVQYKGQEFEKLFINAMNAINFVNLGNFESALVETRRLNQKVVKLRTDGKTEFSESPFAFYLSAMLWEAERQVDDAYIAYNNAFKAGLNNGLIQEDLIRSALRAGRKEEAEKWKKSFPEIAQSIDLKSKNLGEVILIVQKGWGPEKRPRPEAPRFPYLYPLPSSTRAAELRVGNANEEFAVKSQTIQSVTEVAIRALEADYARLVASRVAGVAAKAVIADQIRQKDELLGGLAWLAMNIADRADLRQWSTLPGEFQVARLKMKPGKYTASIYPVYGTVAGDAALKSFEIEVKPNQKVFLTARFE